MWYIVIESKTDNRWKVQADSADEAQRIVTLRIGVAVAKTKAFVEGFVSDAGYSLTETSNSIPVLIPAELAEKL